MADDGIAASILAALADALRDYAASCTPAERARLVHTLDEHGVEVAGVNVSDQPPSGGAS
jgi:hypothetical protein